MNIALINMILTSTMLGVLGAGSILFLFASFNDESILNRSLLVLGFAALIYAFMDLLTVYYGFFIQNLPLANRINLVEQVVIALVIPGIALFVEGLDRNSSISKKFHHAWQLISWLIFLSILIFSIFFPESIKTFSSSHVNPALPWSQVGRGERGGLLEIRDFVLIAWMLLFFATTVNLYFKQKVAKDWSLYWFGALAAVFLGLIQLLEARFDWAFSEEMPLIPGIMGFSIFVIFCMIGAIRQYLKDQRSLVQVNHDLKESKDRLNYLASNDPLTDLPNRVSLDKKLTEELNQIERKGSTFSFIKLNLDNFRIVNDSLGFASGDYLLKVASDRIRSHLRDSDDLYRLEGDEFAIVLENVALPTQVAIVAQKIISAFDSPFTLRTSSHFLGVSMGIVMCPNDCQSKDEILRMADDALVDAKKDKNTFRFYEKLLDQETHRGLSILNELRHALDRQTLAIYYQPICKPTGEVIGAEALLRWPKEDGSFLSPQIFVPIAESTGLIKVLGEWVIVNALKDWREIYEENPDLFLSINLSVKQLKDSSLSGFIKKQLDFYGIPKESVHFEITETALMDSHQLMNPVLKGLQDQDYKLAIDDFGVGYSSLAYLRSLPVDLLKIDRSFINNASTGQKDRLILESIIKLVSEIGLEIIAEGVETKEQVDFLTDMSCLMLQGFYFSKAVDPNQFKRLLNKKLGPEGS